MRLLRARDFTFEEFFGEEVPPYAILSHTWGNEEISYQDMSTGYASAKLGFFKIKGCCRRALSEGLDHVWIDTCCINKESAAELSEAINSMYRWYQRAAICYAYLADIEGEVITLHDLRRSRWFTRGWTLQELIAPREISFFSSTWRAFG